MSDQNKASNERSPLEVLLMDARSALRQALCPQCNRSGCIETNLHCDWCVLRFDLNTALLSFPGETTADYRATATTCQIIRTFERALVKIDTYSPSSTVQPVQIARDALREAYGPNYRSAVKTSTEPCTFPECSHKDVTECGK